MIALFEAALGLIGAFILALVTLAAYVLFAMLCIAALAIAWGDWQRKYEARKLIHPDPDLRKEIRRGRAILRRDREMGIVYPLPKARR